MGKKTLSATVNTGINAIEPGGDWGDIQGKVMVVRASWFRKDEDWTQKDRRFAAASGFGCSPGLTGSAVYGTFLIDGEDARLDRGLFDGIAVDQSIPTKEEQKARAEAAQAEEDARPIVMGYLALGPGCWAKGATPEEAMKELRSMMRGSGRRNWPYQIYHVDTRTRLDGMGAFTWPRTAPAPKLVEERTGATITKHQ